MLGLSKKTKMAYNLGWREYMIPKYKLEFSSIHAYMRELNFRETNSYLHDLK
jgi:hypothetical protein